MRKRIYNFSCVLFITFCGSFLCNKCDLFARAISIIFGLITYTFSALVSSIALSMFGINIANSFSYEIPTMIYFANLLFIFSFSFIFVIIVKMIKSKSKNGFKHKIKYTLFLIFPFTHIFSALQLMNVYRVTRQSCERTAFFKNSKTDYFMIGLSLICLLIDFSIIFFIDSFEKIEQKALKMKKRF